MENALDAVIVADRDLHMTLLPEAASGVKSAALGEHPAHGIERLDHSAFRGLSVEDAVQMAQDRTIQKAQYPIGIGLPLHAPVFGHGKPRKPLHFLKGAVRGFEQRQILPRNEIQAVSKINHRANDRRL